VPEKSAAEDLLNRGFPKGSEFMSVDAIYSYLIDFTWLFLGSWVTLLLMAGVMVFAPDWPITRLSSLTGGVRRN
jgi:hypothetical protein